MQKLGERVPQDSQLILVGGSALALLGNPRSTIDLDFWGDDLRPNPLHRLIIQVASELKIHAEAVPLERFIPLPDGSDRRNLRMGNLVIWKSLLLTLTALPLVNWTAALIPIWMTLYFSYETDILMCRN